MTDQLVTPVILCGGAGTRLWPVSREKMPKHFVPLIGTSSTFQQVLDRVTREGLFAPPMIITNSDFRFVVAEQARARGVKATIILEPQRRDSAAAIAAASELAIKNDPGRHPAGGGGRSSHPRRRGVCGRLPHRAAGRGGRRDRHLRGQADLSGLELWLYPRQGRRTNGSAVRKVAAFVEKPDEATAARYVADGYLWNSGNFMFRAEVMLRELARLRARDHEGRQGRRRQPGLRSRFLPPRRRPVRAGAQASRSTTR